MANPRPANAGKGRPKGVPNKLTATVKDMILTALNDAGGVEYLRKQADANPVAFLSLVGKVMPTQLVGADDASGNPTPLTLWGQPVGDK